MKKELNHPVNPQTNTESNSLPIQTNITIPEKKELNVEDMEEEQAQQAFQRRPQFRVNERNKGRTS